MTKFNNSTAIKARKSLFLPLLVAVVLFLNLIVIVAVVLSIKMSYTYHEERAAVATRNLAKVFSDNIDGLIGRIELCLRSLEIEAERSFYDRKFKKQELDAFIEQSKAFLPELEGLLVADTNGNVIFGIGKVEPVNISDHDYFVKTRDNPTSGLVISKPEVSRMSGKLVLNFAHRLNYADNAFAGVIFAQLALDHLAESFSKIDVGKIGVVTLRDSEMGLIMHHPEFKGPGNEVGSKQLSQEFMRAVASNREEGTYFTSRSIIDGLPRIFSYQKISYHPMYLVVGLAKSDYLAKLKSDAVPLLVLALLFISATLVSASVIYGRWRSKSVQTDELLRSHDFLESRVTERTNELEVLNFELSALAAELSITEERERRQIASELHDNLGQNLVIAKTRLDDLVYVTSCGKCTDSIVSISQTLDQVIQEVRSMTFQISLPLLYEIGLEAALEWLSDEYKEKHGLRVRLETDGKSSELSSEQRTVIFQVIRELFINVVKHANTDYVSLKILNKPDALRIEIKDSGIGFDVTLSETERAQNKNFGLFNIRQRIRHLGGFITIDSEAGCGTMIVIDIPTSKTLERVV